MASSDLEKQLANLSPAKRALLERKRTLLRVEGMAWGRRLMPRMHRPGVAGRSDSQQEWWHSRR